MGDESSGGESDWNRNSDHHVREGSSATSSNGDAVEIVRSSDKPIAEVARELGIYDSTLGNWVKQDEINRGEREGLTSDERARLGELERENARLRMERETLNLNPPFLWLGGVVVSGGNDAKSASL